MDTRRPQTLSVFSLVARWLAFASALLACARRASRMQRTGAPEAWASAHQLELCARTALIEIMRDVWEVQAREDTLRADEQAAFRRLTTLAGTLIALSFFAQHLQQKLAGRGAGFVVAKEGHAPEAAPRAIGIGRAAPGYLDSS